MPYSKYNRRDYVRSKYIYEDVDVLVNFLGIKDQKILERFEADVTYQRQLMLEKEDYVKGRFSKTHLKNIHRFIFQDVYPFAGHFRTESVFKVTNGVRTDFCRSEHIVSQLDELLTNLRNEDYLIGISFGDFILRLAHYMNELNLIHPFPEGNGRSIREYIRELALKSNYKIHWSRLNKDELLDAMIRAANGDLSRLEKCLRKSIIDN